MKKITRAQVAGPSTIPVVEAIDDVRPQGRDGDKRFVLEQTSALLGKVEKQYDQRFSRSNPKGRSSSRGSFGNNEVPLGHVYKIREVLSHNAMEKFDDLVMSLTERKVIDTLKTCDVDHNKALTEGELRSALNSLPLSILEDESGIRESFESDSSRRHQCEGGVRNC